jgi:cytochrome c oxidase subunit III
LNALANQDPMVVPTVSPMVGAAAHESTADSAVAATRSVGMAIALGALTMTFAALLLATAIVRAQASTWPPPGEATVPHAWSWPIAATLAALLGSGAMRVAHRNARATVIAAGAGDRRRLVWALVAAAGAGAAFIGIQLAGWRWLAAAGVRPSSGMVASVLYALTLFHALHALAALLALLPTLVRALRGRRVSAAALASLASFWHLVTIVWIVVFLAVFVA